MIAGRGFFSGQVAILSREFIIIREVEHLASNINRACLLLQYITTNIFGQVLQFPAFCWLAGNCMELHYYADFFGWPAAAAAATHSYLLFLFLTFHISWLTTTVAHTQKNHTGNYKF